MTTHEDKAPSAARDLTLQLVLALDLHTLLASEGPAQAVPRLHLAATILETLSRYVRTEIEKELEYDRL
jgi:hypothetical protein